MLIFWNYHEHGLISIEIPLHGVRRGMAESSLLVLEPSDFMKPVSGPGGRGDSNNTNKPQI